MNKEIIVKMARFVELSKKFSNRLCDIIDEDSYKLESNSIILQSTTTFWGDDAIDIGIRSQIDGRELYIEEDGTVKAKDNKGVSVAEAIMVVAEAKSKLAEEYAEYLELQENLGEYFNSVNKLTKNK